MPWTWLEDLPLSAKAGTGNHRGQHGRSRSAVVSRLRWYGPRGANLAMSLIDADADRAAVAQLEALARELAGQNLGTRVASDSGTLNLSVVNPAIFNSRETIAIAQADDGAWWFWWSWGDRIARITDIETAAFKIAYVLTPQVGG